VRDEGNTYRDVWEVHLEEHARTFERARTGLAGDFEACADLLLTTLRGGGTAFFCGNGGSAADAQHLAAELTVRFLGDRPALRAASLAMDASALTACGNDFGFERIFARQLEALGRPGDALVALSTSGNSPNILTALRAARTLGISSILMTGGRASEGAGLADVTVAVPSGVTASIQEIHIVFGHALCMAIEREFGT
jgi:D-sedoheptulose 7-phosphate isomerase